MLLKKVSPTQVSTYVYINPVVALLLGSLKHIVERVAEIAKKRGVLRTHIALAWLLQKKPVTAPIIGATKISHLEEAVGALSVKLTEEEVVYLEVPYMPHAITGHQ